MPEHWFDGFRPHVTRTPIGRARAGRVPLPTAVVAEIAPDGDPRVALVVGAFLLGATSPASVDAPRAARLWSVLAAAGVRAWVIGGWGVDALLGETTREHHDLDLFVHVADLARLDGAMSAASLAVRTVWSENRWIESEGRPFASAFVADGLHGEVDVHVVDVVDGRVVPLSASTVELPEGALDGRGRIGSTEVRCATAAAQLVMHTGYEVPAHQTEDLRRLRLLLG